MQVHSVGATTHVRGRMRADGDTTRACARPLLPVQTVIFSDVRQTPGLHSGCSHGRVEPAAFAIAHGCSVSPRGRPFCRHDRPRARISPAAPSRGGPLRRRRPVASRRAADRAGGAAVPALAAAAVGALVDRVVAGWVTAVLPGLRRIAAPRCVPGTLPGPAGALEPVVTVLARRPSVTLPGPDPPPSAAGALLAGVTGGTWRLALVPAAVLPAVGLPALGGRALLPPALGVALALLVTAARAHRTAADRARLRRWADDVVMVVRSELDTELARRLIDVERVAAAELDELVARRLDLIDTELRALAAGG